jgi:hypothetical protein
MQRLEEKRSQLLPMYEKDPPAPPPLSALEDDDAHGTCSSDTEIEDHVATQTMFRETSVSSRAMSPPSMKTFYEKLMTASEKPNPKKSKLEVLEGSVATRRRRQISITSTEEEPSVKVAKACHKKSVYERTEDDLHMASWPKQRRTRPSRHESSSESQTQARKICQCRAQGMNSFAFMTHHTFPEFM